MAFNEFQQPPGGDSKLPAASSYSWSFIAVWTLGALTAISGAVGLLGGVHVLAFGSISTGGSFVFVNVFRLLLGAGILMRKEIARRVYVFVAVVGLVFAVIGSFLYLATAQGARTIDFLAVLVGLALDVVPLALLTSASVKREFS